MSRSKLVVATKTCSHLEKLKRTRIKAAVLFVSMALLGASLFGLLIYGVNAKVIPDSKQLILTNVISRHGIRTPVDTYPKDPYVNYTFEPNGWGQLTNEGKRELFALGKELRARYGRLLGAAYRPEAYRSRSTDSDRTLASVQLINAGLWVPAGPQIWGPLGWQPVPVRYQPLDQDKLLLVRVPCPRYGLEHEEVLRSEPVREQLKLHKPLFEYLEKSTGKTVRDFYDVQDIFTTLQAEKAFNLSLPKWTEGYFPEQMERPSAYSFKLDVYNKNLVRLTGGWLLKKVLNDVEAKVNGSESEVKMYLYGGHDRTIVMALAAMKLFGDGHVPDYAATVLIELYLDRGNNQYYIQVHYRKSFKSNFKLLTVPGCEKTCRLDKFSELLSEHVPGSWDDECRTDDVNYSPPPPRGP